MSTFAIAGLSSGIDTTSLISQLMTVAAQPQNALKTQLSNQQTLVSAYQSLNTKLQALQTAADAVNNTSTWSAAKATSSNSSVIASTTTGAVAGSSATFDITQLASAQISTLPANSSSVVSNPSSGIDITDQAGTVHHVDLSDGSAAGVAAAVNNAGVGVRAAVVNTDNGPLLQFTGTATGAKNAFTISGLDNMPTTLVAAQDAKINVGDPAAGGYAVSSSTNTFANAIPGVTFTAGAVGTGVTISVTNDSGAMSDKVKAMVDAANSVLTELAGDTGKGGLMQSNYQINAVMQSVLNTVSHGDGTGNSLSSVGITLTSKGQFTFDASAFASAYTADPSATQKSLSGLAASVSSLASSASINTVGGLITAGNSQVTALTTQISDWDTRLADQQTALQAKYTAMEVALQKIKSTSTWLTQALASATGQTSSSSSSSSS